MNTQAPLLSAIIISQNDEDVIEEVVRSVVEQEVNHLSEVIVVTSGTDKTAEIVRTAFPLLNLLVLDSPALPGKARNAGLTLAKGKYVSFPGSHVILPPGSLEARIEAHELGYTMVTGSILNGTDTRVGWASYFMDHSDSLPGRPSQELSSAPAHCSYNREILVRSGLFPEDRRAGEDTIVNTRLWIEGESAYRYNKIYLYHRSQCTTTWRLIKHHFQRGRAWGLILLENNTDSRSTNSYVQNRYRMTERNVGKWGEELIKRYYRVRHLIFIGICSAYIGMRFEYLRNKWH